MNEPIMSRLERDGRFVEALEFALNQRVDPKKTKAIRCPDPSHHKNGDANESAMTCPDVCGIKCAASGQFYGLLQIMVLRGKAIGEADAAKIVAERFYPENGHSNGHAAPAGQASRPAGPAGPAWVGTGAWPWFPKTAERLGWTLLDDALQLPTWAPGGRRGRTKIRRKKGSGPTATFENDGDDCGLVNLPAVDEHSAGVDSPSCALVCGETDLLAWTYACDRDGLQIPGVSHSTGEGSSLTDWARHFKGFKVYFFPDNDQPGRDNAPKRVAELVAAGARVFVVHPPDPHKDVCDWVRAGAKPLDMMRLAEKAAEVPFTPIGALDLMRLDLPPIEEIVAPRIVYRGGVTVMVASYKRGKSLAALGLCVDLVLGMVLGDDVPDEALPTWLGQKVVGRGPALIYSAEGGERMIQERLRKMVKDPTDAMNQLFIYAKSPAPQLDDDEQIDACFAHAERVEAAIIVFDPLGRFWTMEEEGDPTTARNLMLAIQTRAEAAYAGRGIAVLIVHHDTKATGTDADSPVTGGRGSGKFSDDADALVNLKIAKDGEAGQSVAKFLLRHAESPSPVDVKIDKGTLRIVALAKDERRQKPKTGRPTKAGLAALEALIRHKKRIPTSRIPDELGVAYGTWRNIRRGLFEQLVETGDFAIYVPAGEKVEIAELITDPQRHETPVT